LDGRAIWPAEHTALRGRLPEAVKERIDLAADWHASSATFDAVLHHGTAHELQQINQSLAQRAGAIVGVQGLAPGDTNIALERLVVERSLSINTAAAGGNASLMTLD
jgi:RHH-type proline utilization regulon transcriptional repressor/proline dehydrogenase/delta 1-pyrroline-5-carboxylate dehydrogenase